MKLILKQNDETMRKLGFEKNNRSGDDFGYLSLSEDNHIYWYKKSNSGADYQAHWTLAVLQDGVLALAGEEFDMSWVDPSVLGEVYKLIAGGYVTVVE
jgi:hypothetical protein